MDILLTHGHILCEDAHELQIMKPYPPLGILYISAYLKQRGFSVGVHDTTFQKPADFKLLLNRERPAVVGIYGNLMTRLRVLQMMREARAAGARVILGGPEPVGYVDEYLRHGADAIVYGEGETTVAELLPCLAAKGPNRLEGIAGIAYRREDGTIGTTPARPLIADLDALPEPDRGAIDLGQYISTWRTHHGASSVSLICTRGCPYQCAWCSHSVFGYSHRRRSPARAADEVQALLERYKPEQLWYADDVFTMHHGWLFEYAAELKRRGLHLPFECISRADRLNEEVIHGLAEMGCSRVWLGSESGSQRILDAMQRQVRVEEVQAMTQALRRHGIQTGMFIMLGYEGEEIDDLEATVRHIKESAPDVVLTTVAYPIKGTPYYELVQARVPSEPVWELRTDRELTIRGRRSRRFYSFATRWMVGSITLAQGCKSGAGLARLAKAAANRIVGRIGMELTENDMER
jgi:anaerobic magnesium-protoporphyrin IX monomethyl ester cyclase